MEVTEVLVPIVTIINWNEVFRPMKLQTKTFAVSYGINEITCNRISQYISIADPEETTLDHATLE